MNGKIERLIRNAREGWATGALASDADFEFVEEAWILYHLEGAFTVEQVTILENIDRYLCERLQSTNGFPPPRSRRKEFL